MVRDYELMYIVRPELDDEALRATVKSVRSIVEAQGGDVRIAVHGHDPAVEQDPDALVAMQLGEPPAQLVAEDVVVVGIESGERHDDASAQSFRYTTGAFIELFADDVRLLEVGLVRVEDDGLLVERVPE